MSRYPEELEYDLITNTNFTLDDIGFRLPERALLAFVRGVPRSSLLSRAVHGQEGWAWSLQDNVPGLLAAVIDELRSFEYIYAQSMSKRRLPRPRPIKRPGIADDDSRKIGKDPIPISEWETFWEGGTD